LAVTLMPPVRYPHAWTVVTTTYIYSISFKDRNLSEATLICCCSISICTTKERSEPDYY
jgi:hypothetical protein